MDVYKSESEDASFTVGGMMNIAVAPFECMEQLTTWIKTNSIPQFVIQTLRNMGL